MVFHDKCTPLQYKGKDTILKDRQDKIQSHVSLCAEGCEFISIKYTNNEVECNCPPQKDSVTLNH